VKYGIFCGLVCLAFAGAEARGVTLVRSSAHAAIPASVRSSPGGYRSYHFWHSGFQGGK
jgi:hypothetical protein